MRVIILGAGGHGHVVADILFHMWKLGRDIELAGLLDDDSGLHGEKVLGLKVHGGFDMLPDVVHDAVVVAVGDNGLRQQLHAKFAEGETFLPAVHSTAIVAPDVTVGPGAMVCAGAVINPHAQIGEGAIVNTGATVDHHNRIGAFAHVAPGVNLGGNVAVGQGAMVGVGSAVKPGVRIGEKAVVGVGSAVIRDVPAGEVWAGNPAKKIG